MKKKLISSNTEFARFNSHREIKDVITRAPAFSSSSFMTDIYKGIAGLSCIVEIGYGGNENIGYTFRHNEFLGKYFAIDPDPYLGGSRRVVPYFSKKGLTRIQSNLLRPFFINSLLWLNNKTKGSLNQNVAVISNSLFLYKWMHQLEFSNSFNKIAANIQLHLNVPFPKKGIKKDNVNQWIADMKNNDWSVVRIAYLRNTEYYNVLFIKNDSLIPQKLAVAIDSLE